MFVTRSDVKRYRWRPNAADGGRDVSEKVPQIQDRFGPQRRVQYAARVRRCHPSNPPSPQHGIDQEVVLERGFYPSGSLAYEKAAVRNAPPAALPPAADPLWLEVVVWVLAAFWRGIELCAEVLAAMLMIVLGLVGAVLAIALAIGTAMGLVAGGYWLGVAVNGETGGMIGSAAAAAVVLLIIVGAANRDRR